jgi:rhodanese-related sulfurtransferase
MKLFENIKPRIIAAVFLIPMAVLLAFVPENKTNPYKLSAEELVGEIAQGSQYFYAEEVADYIIKEDPSIQLIDVRSSDEYEEYHLPGAINIPLSDILSEEWESYLDQNVLTNVFYSNGTVNANQAWLITTQLGYKNNYVLQGGLNHWAEVIMNPEKPAETAPRDEFAKYDFRKAMNNALGGGTLEETDKSEQVAPPIPVISTKKDKKRPAGGC